MHGTERDVSVHASKLKVLNEIRRRGRVARVDIAEVTGLSRATVTALTADLIAEGLVIEADGGGAAGAARGRPRVLLGLNPEAHYVFGVKISPHRVAVSIANFVGDVIASHAIAVRAGRRSAEEVADLVTAGIEETARISGLAVAGAAGVGIGIPGFIDNTTGICRWSAVFDEPDVDFRSVMARRTGAPIAVDNDANIVALAEQWYGLGRETSDFIVVTMEHGVGMGLVVDDRLHRGFLRFGSEFGHTKIRPDGALCRCGQRGCVEAYVADYALIRDASTFMATGDISDPIEVQRAVDELIAMARAGHTGAVQLYRRAGEMLGIGLANLINVLNPPLVILAGQSMRASDLFWDVLIEAVDANTVSAVRGATAIEVHPLSDETWAQGGAALVLERLYRPAR
jgi:transcriptional regulator of PTS gene